MEGLLNSLKIPISEHIVNIEIKKDYYRLTTVSGGQNRLHFENKWQCEKYRTISNAQLRSSPFFISDRDCRHHKTKAHFYYELLTV